MAEILEFILLCAVVVLTAVIICITLIAALTVIDGDGEGALARAFVTVIGTAVSVALVRYLLGL